MIAGVSIPHIRVYVYRPLSMLVGGVNNIQGGINTCESLRAVMKYVRAVSGILTVSAYVCIY